MRTLIDLQNKLLMAVSFVRAVADTSRVDAVLAMLNRLESPEMLRPLIDTLRKDPETARLIDERPLLGRIDLEALRNMPEGTLGRRFADHLIAHDLDPNYFAMHEPINDLNYIPARLRETHDLWHLATGIDMSPAGEAGLQAFYLAQIDGPLPPMILMIALGNAFFKEQRDFANRIDAIARGWILGRRARPLLHARWEQLWDLPVEEVRRQFNIDRATVDALLAPRPERAAA